MEDNVGYAFHPVTGTMVQLTNGNRTGERLLAKSDFNNGLVFSHTPLQTNKIFQVRIEKKVGLWSGSIELGVTTVNPDTFTSEAVPQSATELRNGTWLMSSKTILQDGETLIENYGGDLEKLEEGDTVGLMRTTQGGLVYFVKGVSQGLAASFVPANVFAVVNLYGKCARISLVDVELSEQCTNTEEYAVPEETSPQPDGGSSENNNDSDKLKFHQRCGPLVKLSPNFRVAERRRPMEEFNNAVVLTHRPLRDNELFQVRIDLLIQKWSGSIEFGLTTHNPDTFDFPATMTIMRNGTVIMSGNGILHDGKATNSPYTHFNLDQLQEGDRIGVMKKANGDIHYCINGTDLGPSTAGITQPVWGAINLYGMAAKVTVVDRNEHEEHNLRLNVRNLDYLPNHGNNAVGSDETLAFHESCGFHAAVINNGRTAHRPNARDDFNHGVVLTNRMLKPNELFEVRLDRMVTKWAGSIEIGVTTHVPTQLDYPCTMTNVRSGTWMMTGNGIMHNGTSIVDEYGFSLDRLKVGDRVGVLRKESGNLHFQVNGVDYGCACTNVPEAIYGVIDLYGQAAQATIIVHSNPEASTGNFDNNKSQIAMINENTASGLNVNDFSGGGTSYYPLCRNEGLSLDPHFYDANDLRFHSLCGKNARISNNGLTASRPNALGEFNAAIVISSRPLRDNELFEVIIERMVDRWSGNIEAGVTTIRPEDLMFPNTMTDIDHDTWMLSGSSVMTGGTTVTNRYNCNLDALTCGSRVGMMRKSDGTLHYVVNSEPIGIAAYDIPQNVYAVVDLYGQCAQVTLTRMGDMSIISSQAADSPSLPLANDASHRFSTVCGKNILLKNNSLTASRIRHFTHGLVFSSVPLELDETFEVRLVEVTQKWAGALIIGVTSLLVTDDYPSSHIPHTIASICADTWLVTGSQVRKNNSILKENFCPNLIRLSVGDRIGIRVTAERNLKVLINGESVGIAATNLPKKMYAVVDLYGSTESITISSVQKSFTVPQEGPVSSGSETEGGKIASSGTLVNLQSATLSFDDKHHGKQIELSNENLTARRISGYNNGLIMSSQPLKPGQLFQVKLSSINAKWENSIAIGVIEVPAGERFALPWSANQLIGNALPSCVVIGDSVFLNGKKIKAKYGPNLSTLQEGNTLGILLDYEENVHMYVNGVSQGCCAKNIIGKQRALVDVYGQCEEVTVQDYEQIPKDRITMDPIIERLVVMSPETLIKTCEYLSLVTRFKKSLCLPEPYFLDSEPVTCYCRACHMLRGDQVICSQGDPPAEYSIPLGWVRFPVNFSFEAFPPANLSSSQQQMMTSSTSSLSNVLTTWHVAYHGLKLSHIRRCMDAGQLFHPGEPDHGSFGGDYFLIQKSNGKDEKTDGAPLVFSPSVDYAAIPEFSPVRTFYAEPGKKRPLPGRAAFQVLVQPGSYKSGPASFPNPLTTAGYRTASGRTEQQARGLDLETIEWATKEQGSTHVSALLLRLD